MGSSISKSPYSNQTVVLTTKHQKLDLIAPILERELGMKLVLHEADTDELGTFSGEIERTSTASETATQKAKIGMKALGLPLGIASEGSIGPDPLMPFMKSDIEYLSFIDNEREIEIILTHRSLEIIAGEIVTEPGVDIGSFLERVDFPNHKLIVVPNVADKTLAIKGIGTLVELKSAILLLAGQSKDGKVLLQSDLRAHCSPSRQQNIKRAAELLAARINSPCPKCQCPGWGVTGYLKGLDCADCGEAVTKAIRAEISSCVKCPFELIGEHLAQFADPSTCDSCNP